MRVHRPVALILALLLAGAVLVLSGCATGGSSGIQSFFTGQSQPTLSIRNDYPVLQYIFVDGQYLGTVATGSTKTFDVSLGKHTITAADSRDGTVYPVSATDTFNTGYSYAYRVYAR
jgi:hypothetical protein